MAEENDVSDKALATFNTYLRQAYKQIQLEKTETGLRRTFLLSPSPLSPSLPLSPLSPISPLPHLPSLPIFPLPHLPLPLSPPPPISHLLLLAEELLLQTERWPRIRACPSCGWLFLDTSKNGRRRWCNMQACGSQAKARRWYHKNKGK
ncbi:MAG: CGNR zinc finger domain-containing protein [Lewinellaceae bacterium]|nr:CGNR zinc finger domain-containing protein [Lewinellaceae bacterium]